MGALRFASGTYRLTKTVVIDLGKTGFVWLRRAMARPVLRWRARGEAFHFIGTHEGTADPGSVKQDMWAKQRMPTGESWRSSAHAGADGFEATGTMQFTITRCTRREARHAVHLTRRNRNVLISDCHFYHNRGIGVYLDQVTCTRRTSTATTSATARAKASFRVADRSSTSRSAPATSRAT